MRTKLLFLLCLMSSVYALGQNKPKAQLIEFSYTSCDEIISKDSIGVKYLNYEEDTLDVLVGLCINCGYSEIKAVLEWDSVQQNYVIDLLDIEVDEKTGDTTIVDYGVVTSCSCYKRLKMRFVHMPPEEFFKITIDNDKIVGSPYQSCILIIEEEVETEDVIEKNKN